MPDREAISLIAAVAAVWPSLVDVFGAHWPEFEWKMLHLLRALDGASPESGSGAREAIVRAFEENPAAYRRLTDALPASARDAGATGTPRQAPLERFLRVPVFYATDRESTNNLTAENWFDGRRGRSVCYGVAEVSIPDDHRMGRIEKPRWWRLEFRPDPSRDVTILGIRPLERHEFIDRVFSAVDRARFPAATIFVHGYNVTFADAVRRTAQIAYDLGFRGVPLLYSWPSEGRLSRYLTDGENAAWSAPRFTEFLKFSLAGLGVSQFHVIAHSMGNRVVANALYRLELSPTDFPGARLGQLVLAAPDLDSAVFRELASNLSRHFQRCTLYASSHDVALRASSRFAGYPRAGQSGEGLVLVDGIDTVDASLLDTGMMSHSYIGDNDSILSDVHDLILNGTPPDGRFRLERKTRDSRTYWFFRR
jgi:esterase/lipase superfamily enzyme